jgi:hypothetical protein
MKAKATALIVSFVIGSVAFSVAHTQSGSNNDTARISSTGTIRSQNPSSWISAVFFQSSQGVSTQGAYQVIFNSSAPSASSCTATPTTSGLTGVVEAPAAAPDELLVSFRQSGSSGGVATPVASGFTLTCPSS